MNQKKRQTTTTSGCFFSKSSNSASVDIRFSHAFLKFHIAQLVVWFSTGTPDPLDAAMTPQDGKGWRPKLSYHYGVVFKILLVEVQLHNSILLLMEEILHQLIGSLSSYLQVLYIPGGAGFLPSTEVTIVTI